MSIFTAAELEQFRADAESLMLDTCLIQYATGNTTQDEDSGSVVPVYADRLTSKCKVQSRNLQARTEEVGGRTATTVSVEIHLPLAGTGAVMLGDVVEIVAVDVDSDPALIGRRFRVIAPVAKSFATARRLDVEELIS